MPLDSSFPVRGWVLDSALNLTPGILAWVPYDSTRGKYDVQQLPDGNPKALVLPFGAAVVYQVYIVNMDPSQTLQVNWTPKGQAQDLAQVLAPGSFLMLWDQQGGPGGVTGVQIQGQGNPLNFEVFLGS